MGGTDSKSQHDLLEARTENLCEIKGHSDGTLPLILHTEAWVRGLCKMSEVHFLYDCGEAKPECFCGLGDYIFAEHPPVGYVSLSKTPRTGNQSFCLSYVSLFHNWTVISVLLLA